MCHSSILNKCKAFYEWREHFSERHSKTLCIRSENAEHSLNGAQADHLCKECSRLAAQYGTQNQKESDPPEDGREQEPPCWFFTFSGKTGTSECPQNCHTDVQGTLPNF